MQILSMPLVGKVFDLKGHIRQVPKDVILRTK